MNGRLKNIPGVDSYIGDIVIYGNTWENHLSTLKKVIKGS